MDYGIWYSKVANFRLCGFTDSDWGSSLDDRRSILANVFSLGSGVITWSLKKQATAALSSSEAEYIAATSAACQAIWLRRILAELQQRQEGATEIFCDNKATIAMTKNPTFHGRTKHIYIHFHFIRDLVAKEELSLKYCSTNEQLADVLTKSLSIEKFIYFRSLLGVVSVSIEMKEKKLTVIGDVDPIALVRKLRKYKRTEILSVGPAKEPEKMTTEIIEVMWTPL
ncbi:hypothetical protein RJ640_000224 [Escallonia rubra]|uniref:Uncharacterized protein n=1 Tax=Escallonia rubra TaxID=112253 RepID=A0AA88SC82_9ASTE|nr:hypothetical protein RJ640_000224 [Escallonia rubra]